MRAFARMTGVLPEESERRRIVISVINPYFKMSCHARQVLTQRSRRKERGRNREACAHNMGIVAFTCV